MRTCVRGPVVRARARAVKSIYAYACMCVRSDVRVLVDEDLPGNFLETGEIVKKRSLFTNERCTVGLHS